MSISCIKIEHFHKTISTPKLWKRDATHNKMNLILHTCCSWKVLRMWDYVKYVKWNSLIITPNLEQAGPPHPTDPDKCTDRYIRINGLRSYLVGMETRLERLVCWPPTCSSPPWVDCLQEVCIRLRMCCQPSRVWLVLGRYEVHLELGLVHIYFEQKQW